MHDTRTVANFFIEKSIFERSLGHSCNLDQNAIQSLVYISNALKLANRREWLVNEYPVTGTHDPYFVSLKKVFSRSGQHPIVNVISFTNLSLRAINENSKPIAFDKIDLQILEHVWGEYRKLGFDSSKLLYLTGGTDARWAQTLRSFGGSQQKLEADFIISNFNFCVNYPNSKPHTNEETNGSDGNLEAALSVPYGLITRVR